jgi:signal transduction histidine kinase/CheY-like chemotaxis protein
MGIRRQTLLFLCLSFLILLALQIVTSDIVVLKGFSDLDDEHARRNVVRAKDELNGMLSRLSAIASDWAYWDPTYHFVKQFDETYVRKNFGPEVLINLGLNFMLFFDRSGRLVFTKSVTLPSGEEQALPEDILMRLQPERLASILEQSHGSISGLLQTTYFPALVALRPILKSDGSGPSTGTLGVGRFLDPSELRRISELTDLDLSLHDLRTEPLPEALKTKANPAPEAKETIRVHRSEGDLLEGYTLLDDVFSETRFFLKVRTPQRYRQHGQAISLYYSAFLLAIGLTFSALILFILGRNVLSPLVSLSQEVKKISTLDDLSRRIAIKGRDEFKQVADSINAMLDHLSERASELKEANQRLNHEVAVRQKAERALRTSQYELEARVAERTAELQIANEKLKREIAERELTEAEQRKLQTQLQRAQKMEAIGTLAGGIAHDFNNLLMAIQGQISLLLLDRHPSEPDYNALKLIEQRIRSGADLTAQLLGYARRGKYENRLINLNDLIEENIPVFRRTRKDIRIHTDLDHHLGLVRGDRGQLELVLLNLFNNASDAMAEGGTLTLATYMTGHADIASTRFRAQPGRYVQLTVTDTGVGMDQDTQERIFEPFFTTKEMGRGTGLGLASVYGIVKGHDGYVDLDSEKGRGTCFRIYLPVSDTPAEAVEPLRSDSVSGSGGVLIVDNEDLVLSVAAEMIEKMGYQVFKAGSGGEALEILKRKKNQIDLVILDMIMPDMSGSQTFDQLMALAPSIRVILSTGYSLDGHAAEIMERGCRGVLQKPFTFQTLALKIKEVLQQD